MRTKIMQGGIVLVLLLGLVHFVSPVSASTPQTYTVLVGSENTFMGVTTMGYYPHAVKIHVGDSVMWVINSHEPHTVTFLAGGSLGPLFVFAPPNSLNSPFQINPLAFFAHGPNNGQYDGSTYVNSGWMSLDEGAVQSFTLTFTQEGVFTYLCYLHSQMMTGTVEVVGSNVSVPSPADVRAQAQAELKADWLNVPKVLAKAKAQIVPPTKNTDGTFTHTITMGYESGNIAILKFFPSNETVQPGDTVVWTMPELMGEGAPHTVTFFNGNPDQPLVVIENGAALINPALFFPSPTVIQGVSLNGSDYFNSGVLGQGSFSLKVGNVSGVLNYECALHDTSGMSATLFVAPRGN